MFITKAKLHGFADDHTLSSAERTLGHLIEILSKESGIAIQWLSNNHMIANPLKFQAIILKKSKESTETTIRIKDKIIKFKTNEGSFESLKNYAFVIGKEKSEITLHK